MKRLLALNAGKATRVPLSEWLLATPVLLRNRYGPLVLARVWLRVYLGKRYLHF